MNTIPNTLRDIEKIMEQSQQTFGKLQAIALNWKPTAKAWSAAQCFDHIIATNRVYLPAFDAIARGEHKGNSLWQKLPIGHAMGKWLVRSVQPEAKRKIKTLAVFQPSLSEVSSSIIQDFVKHQEEELLPLIRQFEGTDIQRIRMSSPASSLFVFTLADAIQLLIGHQWRHFAQAEQVLSHPSFPPAKIEA